MVEIFHQVWVILCWQVHKQLDWLDLLHNTYKNDFEVVMNLAIN